jgi:hypothetical protein
MSKEKESKDFWWVEHEAEKGQITVVKTLQHLHETITNETLPTTLPQRDLKESKVSNEVRTETITKETLPPATPKATPKVAPKRQGCIRFVLRK